ncbi:MAG: hypothetical protein FWF87_00455 [Synergistaceae bacterium]|nr:hypothetical protein [Synergistaceae bacterium]
MLNFINRFIRLIFGLFLYSLGVVLTIKGDIGLLTWDVLHQGISIHVGITMGQASITVGFVIVAIAFFMGEKIGFGTVLNMLLIGTFMDILLESGLFPKMDTQVSGFAMVTAGLIVIAFASYFYIGAGFGAGPRDSLMVMLVRKMNCRVGVARAIVEGTAVALGWLLGGFLGVGTLYSVFGVSIAVQFVFFLLKFDVKKVRQESLADTYINLKEAFKTSK